MAENIAQASTLDELLLMIVRLLPLLLGCDRRYCMLWQREHSSFPLAAYGLAPAQRATFINAIREIDAPLLAEAHRTMVPLELTCCAKPGIYVPAAD
ncbi:MAG: hypothetical protein U0074_02345 [Kouleothrix sp.]